MKSIILSLYCLFLFQKRTPVKTIGVRGWSPFWGPLSSVISIVVLLIVASGLGSYWWSRGKVTTDDAYVDGHIYRFTPRIAGYVTKVFVTVNQKVKKGEPLLSLDTTEYEVALAETRANPAEAESTLTSLELGVPLEKSQTAQRVRGARPHGLQGATPYGRGSSES
jgi:multidrug resistance efflux pump